MDKLTAPTPQKFFDGLRKATEAMNEETARLLARLAAVRDRFHGDRPCESNCKEMPHPFSFLEQLSVEQDRRRQQISELENLILDLENL